MPIASRPLPDDFRIKILLDNGLLIQKNAVIGAGQSIFLPVLDKLFGRILAKAILPVLEGFSLRWIPGEVFQALEHSPTPRH